MTFAFSTFDHIAFLPVYSTDVLPVINFCYKNWSVAIWSASVTLKGH